MGKDKLFRVICGALCGAVCLLTVAGALSIYLSGAEAKASDPLAWIYTREKAAPWVAGILLLSAVVLGLAGAGRILGVRAETAAPRKSVPKAFMGVKAPRGVGAVRIILLAAAGAMIAAGVVNGSMRDVLVKAVNLCTECVGLG